MDWSRNSTGAANVPTGYYNESEFTAPDERCPHPEHWHTYDAQATEIEVIDMVYGLIRGLQPDVCLETGTSRGFLATRIGEALSANVHGHLHTFEPDEDTWDEAFGRVAVAGLCHRVTCHNLPSMVPWTHGAIDFAWFDSLIELRAREFSFYRPYMHRRTVVGFHDTAPRFEWRERLDQFVDADLQLLDLPTPRGVTLGRVCV